MQAVMDYEWDDKKDKRNVAKHGVAFDVIDGFDWDNALVSPDGRNDYGETRFIAYGYIGFRLYACVYTLRNEKRRLISLRKANQREENFYESQTIDIEIEASDE